MTTGSRMLRLIYLAQIGLVLSLLSCSQIPEETPVEWQLVFQDEFDGDSLDLTKWNTVPRWGRTDPKGDKQHYIADEAVEVSDGYLRIKAEKRNLGGKAYTSGLIETGERFTQTYGYFEIRAQLPQGQGFWPAFWLLQAETYPPEIDIFEALGHKPNAVYLTHHWEDAFGEHQSYTHEFRGPDFTAGFHTFAVKWTHNEIVWYVDGVEEYRTGEGVPQSAMYLIVDLAVGGAWPGNPDSTTPFPGVLIVDYVRVYTPVQAEPANEKNTQRVCQQQVG